MTVIETDDNDCMLCTLTLPVGQFTCLYKGNYWDISTQPCMEVMPQAICGKEDINLARAQADDIGGRRSDTWLQPETLR
jgi:hypothetical protein